MVPTDTKVYSNTRSSKKFRELYRLCERRLVVHNVVIIAANLFRFRRIPIKKSEANCSFWHPWPKSSVRVKKILKTWIFWKFSNSHFQNFEKIDLIILANRSDGGRRTNFRDKKSSDFSGEICRERNFGRSITAPTALFPLIGCGVDSFSPN